MPCAARLRAQPVAKISATDLGDGLFLLQGAGCNVERNPLAKYEAEFGDASAFLDGAFRSMQIAYVPD